MYTFDASSVIFAWETYPIENFPTFWEWISKEIQSKEFQISQTALSEVERKYSACGDWLENEGIERIALSSSIIQEAQRIKKLLRIENDDYKGGVGENDLFIIATAKLVAATLLTEESHQPTPPKVLANSKIPAVCQFNSVNVKCSPFIQMLREKGPVF